MKKFLTSTRGTALILAVSLAVIMLCIGNTQKLRDAPLKAKAVWSVQLRPAE